MASFCFRACSSEASLEQGGDQRRTSLRSLPSAPAVTGPGEGQAMASNHRARSGPTACLLSLRIPRQTHLEALATASGSGAGMQKQAAGARLVSPAGPWTTQVCESVLSISVYCSPCSSCT